MRSIQGSSVDFGLSPMRRNPSILRRQRHLPSFAYFGPAPRTLLRAATEGPTTPDDRAICFRFPVISPPLPSFSQLRLYITSLTYTECSSAFASLAAPAPRKLEGMHAHGPRKRAYLISLRGNSPDPDFCRFRSPDGPSSILARVKLARGLKIKDLQFECDKFYKESSACLGNEFRPSLHYVSPISAGMPEASFPQT
ncbi:hypothetical protein FIBSPDRAFT_897360 [Athelia psychrophila]|uniref:Uncharacterized protein n=1 Tax=Athelia psychrophila TaxID=1759441 RepID=A0A166CA80_9AGAM|nr:hypothetical protein FIBSPDRAFT_897360 [Fibularhizoctonia sp. CBS 109695]